MLICLVHARNIPALLLLVCNRAVPATNCSCNRAVLACLALSSSVIALYVLVPNVSRWVTSHTERCKACKTSQLRCFVAENGAMANTDKYSMCKNALQAGRDTRSSVLDGHR